MAHHLPSSARCVVIGAGLLGSHIALELARDGHPTVVVSRSFSPWFLAQRPGERGIALVESSLASSAEVKQLLVDAEIVFLMAGSSTPAGADRDPAEALGGSVQLGLRVFDAMRRAGTRRVVLASSGGTVYGRVTRLPTPEDHPTRPISLHGVNALALESYAEFFAREHALAPLVLRFSNVYGPGQRVRADQGVLAAWCGALATGRPITVMGDEDIRRDFVYAEDAARAAVRAAIVAPPGVYNVGGGASWSLESLLELLHEVSGREEVLHRVPRRAVDVPVTELDITRLIDATGWRPSTSMVDGLGATWEWVAQATALA